MTDGEKLDLLLVKMDTMESKMDQMESRMDQMESKMDVMQDDIHGLQDDMVCVKLKIENEISPNIQRVAEGHLDLSRIFHEAMRPNSEMEMLGIKVRMLESDVKQLKQKVF